MECLIGEETADVRSHPIEREDLVGLWLILIIIAIVLILLGVFVEVAKFLLWVGIALLVVGIIWWLMQYIAGRRST